jgi:hypothetical protein
MKYKCQKLEKEEEKIQFGKNLFIAIDELKLPICDSGTHSTKGFFIMRGSYHMLANDLRVGWHPEYEDRLCRFKPNFKQIECI